MKDLCKFRTDESDREQDAFPGSEIHTLRPNTHCLMQSLTSFLFLSKLRNVHHGICSA